MRNTKNITILDDKTELKFKLTAMSARAQQKWLARLIGIVIKSGLLKADGDENITDLSGVARAITKSGFAFLGQIDAEEAEKLLLDLVCETAVKLTGRGVIPLDEHEIDATFTELKALFELEKQCFGINFDFFKEGEALSGLASLVNNQTSKVSNS